MIIKLFPKPVYRAASGLAEQYIDQLVKWLEPRYEPRGNFVQTQGDLQDQSECAPIVDLAVAKAKTFTEEIGYAQTDFFVTQMWANKYVQQDQIMPHFHTNSYLSGVVYLKFSEGSGRTFFADSDESDLRLELKRPTIYTNGIHAVRASRGDVILFRSNMAHGNHPNTDNEDRVTISFNMMPVRMGKKGELTYLEFAGSNDL